MILFALVRSERPYTTRTHHSCNTRKAHSFYLPLCRTNIRKFSIFILSHYRLDWTPLLLIVFLVNSFIVQVERVGIWSRSWSDDVNIYFQVTFSLAWPSYFRKFPYDYSCFDKGCPTEKPQSVRDNTERHDGLWLFTVASSSSRVFSAFEGGAMNTCLRVLKETKWILSF